MAAPCFATAGAEAPVQELLFLSLSSTNLYFSIAGAAFGSGAASKSTVASVERDVTVKDLLEMH